MPSHNDPLAMTGEIADLRRRSTRHGSALAAVQVPQPAKQSWTVATTSTSPTVQLSYLPYNGTLGSSINLSWNDLEIREGTDYTVDYSTGLITLASGVVSLLRATPTPADVLTVDYWTTGDLAAAAITPDVGVLMSDTFNRADSTTTVNPASDGGTWTPDSTVWGISSNQGYPTSTAAPSSITWMTLPAIRRDSGAIAFDIQADNHRVNSVAGTTVSGLMGSADPVGSGGTRRGYGVRLGGTISGPVNIDIVQLVNSSINILASTTAANWVGSTVTFRFTHDGAGGLRLLMGGSTILTYTDPGPFSPLGTWVGLLSHTTAGAPWDAWDNFQALSAG